MRLVFSIWDDVQVRKTWPNAGFDFRPVMKNIADALNAGVPGVKFVPGMAFDAKGSAKILEEDAKAGDVMGYLVIQMNSWPNALAGIVKASKPTLFCSFPYSGIGGWDENPTTGLYSKPESKSMNTHRALYTQKFS